METNLFISFSGGRTSAYMTKWILENIRCQYKEVVVLFANTGQENEETLNFVNRCDKEWGFNVVWIEAKVNKEKIKVLDLILLATKLQAGRESLLRVLLKNMASLN